MTSTPNTRECVHCKAEMPKNAFKCQACKKLSCSYKHLAIVGCVFLVLFIIIGIGASIPPPMVDDNAPKEKQTRQVERLKKVAYDYAKELTILTHKLPHGTEFEPMSPARVGWFGGNTFVVSIMYKAPNDRLREDAYRLEYLGSRKWEIVAEGGKFEMYVSEALDEWRDKEKIKNPTN